MLVIEVLIFRQGPNSRQTWIELCQAGSVDPNSLIHANLESIIFSTLEATDTTSKVRQLSRFVALFFD